LKKLILIGIILLLSGCSVKSYNKTVVYPDHTKKTSYQSMSIDKDECNCDYYNDYYDPFCDCSRGMYLEDDVGW